MALHLPQLHIVMTLLDILIIYAACGAPFVIHDLTLDRPRTGISRFVWAIVAGLIWPITLAKAIIHAVRSSAKTEDRFTTAISMLCDEFERSLQLSPANARVFRDDAERFVELNAVMRMSAKYDLVRATELFKLAGNRDSEIAARCYERKTRRILEGHAQQARVKFLATLGEITIGDQTFDARDIFERFERLTNATAATETADVRRRFEPIEIAT